MPSFKLFVSALCCALLLCLEPSAIAQKKNEPAAPASPPQTPFSNVRRDSLLNGMQIITLEKNDQRVRVDLAVRVGAMFDLTGKTGLAALTQSTLLAANPRLKEEIESLQGKIDWGIDWDLSWFRLEVPPENFETAIEIIGRLLVVENIRAEAFKNALDAQLAEIKTRVPSPAERAEAAFLAALYGPHPYGHSILGEEATLVSIKQGDVLDFARRFYIANDVVAVSVGPIQHDRVLRTFKFVFGGWVKAALVPSTFRQPPRVTELKLVKVDVPDARRVELRGGLIGLKIADQDYPVVELMARIIDARLKREAAAMGAEQVAVRSPIRVLSSPFYFTASVAPERAEAFSRAATDAFASLANNPVTAEELAAAKASLRGERDQRSTGEQLREVEFFSLPRNYPLTYGARVDAVTSADVARVAKQLFAANALTLVVLGPIGDRFKS
jgi:zinc protease